MGKVGHLQLAFVAGSKTKSTDIFNILMDQIEWICFLQFSLSECGYSIYYKHTNRYFYLYRKCRMGMTFIQANITLSTLLGFNLLVAVRANCKYDQLFSHNLRFTTSCNIVYHYISNHFWSNMQIRNEWEY